MTNHNILIEAHNVSKHYGKQQALTNFNLLLKRGEVLGLLGVNGAGKTTTLQILTGHLAPSQGYIKLSGINLATHPQQAKKKLGYLPEKPPLYNDLTVDEYLFYVGRLQGLSKNKLKTSVNYAKERCHLQSVSKRLIIQLSKGFQQRVGIAQAILHKPELIILDEPTVGLDPIQLQEIRELIAELAKENSVILSSHILTEVEATCNRVIILQQGEIIYQDSLQQDKKQIKISFYNPPPIEELCKIPQVETAVSIDKQSFILTGNLDIHSFKVINQYANQWQIYQLCHQKQTLEQIFLELR